MAILNVRVHGTGMDDQYTAVFCRGMGHQPLRKTEYSCAHWSLLIFTLKEGGDDDIFIIFEREHRVKKTEDYFFLRVYIRTGRARIQFF